MGEREQNQALDGQSRGAAAASSYQPGFVESWLRRSGTRPWPCFLRLWVIALIATILLSFVGFSHQSIDAQPPDPRSIPYADWLPGGDRSEEGVLALSPQDLPEYDKTLRSQRIGVTLTSSPDKHNDKRLMAWRAKYIGTLGWPWLCATWGSQIHWDVTNPNAEFPPFAIVDRSGPHVLLHNGSFGLSVWCADRSTAHTIALYAPGILMQLALPQLVAAIVVFLSRGVYRRRRRRRKSRGCCLDCGHGLDPSRIVERCPECGSVSPMRDGIAVARPRRLLQRPAALSMCLFLLLVLAWTFVQPFHWEKEVFDPVGEQLQRRADIGRQYTHRILEYAWGWGWPVSMMYGQVELGSRRPLAWARHGQMCLSDSSLTSHTTSYPYGSGMRSRT